MKPIPVLIALAALSASAKPFEAVFTSFAYSGHDAVYDAHPLGQGEFYNPVIAGWSSDPSVVRTGDDYWLVTSTFGYFPGVPLYHSNDLANWKLVRNILDRPSQLDGLAGQSLDKGGIYAPQISYNTHNGLYYMITTDTGRKNGHFYVTTDDPRTDWSDPVWLDGIDGIDPSFFFDDDGRAYIVYKEETAGRPKWSNYRCIRFIEFDTAAGQTVGESWPLSEEGVDPVDRFDRAEGPHIYKVDGRYYLLTAEGGTGPRHSANIYRADNIRGPYLRSWRNPILTQRMMKDNRPDPVTCAGHADFVQTPSGDWYAVFLGQRPGPGKVSALGRETFLMPVHWSKDGWPWIVQCESDPVPVVLGIEGVTVDSSTCSSGNYRWSDNFTATELRPEWLSLRGAAPVTVGSGRLSLPCSEATSLGKGTPAYVGRRIAHHAFDVSATLDFHPKSASERAGLLLIKNESAQYFFSVGKSSVELIKIGKNGREVIASAARPSSKKPLTLVATTDGLTYKFSYQIADSEPVVVADVVDASFLSGERTGGFTGATVGLYAESL